MWLDSPCLALHIHLKPISLLVLIARYPRKDEDPEERRRAPIKENDHSLKGYRVKVPIEHRAPYNGRKVEEDELSGNHDFAVEFHQGTVEVADLGDACY